MGALLTKKLFGRLGGWIGMRLVQDVPEDIAACEFDCSKEECAGPELLNCQRRIRSEAAELSAGAEKNHPSGQLDEAVRPTT
ncbi:MAG: hypothetical protein U1E42_15285 [Rhodospirillales bacterium]